MPDGQSLLYCAQRQNGFEILLRRLDGSGGERPLTTDGQQSCQPSPSPDGSEVAYHSPSRGGIWVIGVAGGAPRQISNFGSAPRWSPNGALVAFQSDPLDLATAISPEFSEGSTIWVVRPHGGGLERVTHPGGPPGGHGAPSFTPDSKDIVFVAETGSGSTLWSVSFPGGSLKKILSGQSRIFDPVVAPAGHEVFYSTISPAGSSEVWSIRLKGDSPASKAPKQIIGSGPSSVRHIAVSPNGRRIAYAGLSMTSHIRILAVAPDGTPGPETTLTSGTGLNLHPVFSPDGKRIAFTRSTIGGSEDVWVANSDGTDPLALTDSFATDTDPSWYPESDRVLFTSDRSGRTRLYSVPATGGEALPLDIKLETPHPRLSPDGRFVAFNLTSFQGNPSVATLDLASGQVKPVTPPDESAGFPQWSPDGRSLSVQVNRGNGVHIGVVPSSGPVPKTITLATFDGGSSQQGGFSPDGSRVLFAGERGGVWNLYWASVDGKGQGQVTRYGKRNTFVRCPSFSPDGRQILYEFAEALGNIWIAEPKR
jgi:TolB protein